VECVSKSTHTNVEVVAVNLRLIIKLSNFVIPARLLMIPSSTSLDILCGLPGLLAPGRRIPVEIITPKIIRALSGPNLG
jgi:hypothetical protein